MDPRNELIERGNPDLAEAVTEALYDEVIKLNLPSGEAKFGRLKRDWYALRNERGRINGIRFNDDLPAKRDGRDLMFKPFPYRFFQALGTLFAEVDRKGDLVGAVGPKGRRVFRGTEDVSRVLNKNRDMFLALYNHAESKGWDVHFMGLSRDNDPRASTHAKLTKRNHMIIVDYAENAVRYGIKQGSRFRPKGKVNLKGLPKLIATYGR